MSGTVKSCVFGNQSVSGIGISKSKLYRFAFLLIIVKFNLKRNFFIRSRAPHLVSDSLNIFLVYYLLVPHICQVLHR